MHVVIVGAGWAGLAAAVELSRQNMPVTVLEAAPYAGGRARHVLWQDLTVDNGQHLLLGAYRELLRLLKVIGVAETAVFKRCPLHLAMQTPGQQPISLSLPYVPAPLHVLLGLLSVKNLSWRERRLALAFCWYLYKRRFSLEHDTSVAALLHTTRQTPRLISALWEPICLAALNTPVAQASAQIFVRVIGDAFNQSRADSDLLFPRTHLSGVFPEPAIRFVQRHGGEVRCGERVLALQIDGRGVQGVVTKRGTIAAEQVILATTPTECLRLIQDHSALHRLQQQLTRLQYEPICTLYLQYPPQITLGQDMVGLLAGMGQWVFDLAHTGRAGLMAVVISGPGAHMDLDNPSLISQIQHELHGHFPHLGPPLKAYVIREKRATFSCVQGVAALRPEMHTAVHGLWLAGDYTATGYPATLEGAVISGVHCAQALQNINT